MGVLVETTARGVDGANARVEEEKKQIAAMKAMIFFMVLYGFVYGRNSRVSAVFGYSIMISTTRHHGSKAKEVAES